MGRATSPSPRKDVQKLTDIPNIGVSMANDLRLLGIPEPIGLVGRDPYAMYDELCRLTACRQDPCVLDTFIAAVRYMEGGPKTPWWKFTPERKKEMAARAKSSPRV